MDIKRKKFNILLISDLDFEEMVADICYEDTTVAMITQENGIENMEVEIFDPETFQTVWNFSLDDFVNALSAAKKQLIKMQREPEK